MTIIPFSSSRLGTSVLPPAVNVIAPRSRFNRARVTPEPTSGALNLGDWTCRRRRFSSQVNRTSRTRSDGQRGNQLEQETHAAGRVFHAVVEYAFGSGDRGLTLVGRDDHGQARELRLSHYRGETQSIWDVTAGHPVHPSDLAENLGQPLTADAVRGCFLCHVTNPQAVTEGSGPGADDHGIGCEKCHGPGGNHVLAMADKFPDLAIARPTLSTGTPIVNLCAQCHSPLGQRRIARRSCGRSLSGNYAHLEPLLQREQRLARLHDLPRPPPQRLSVNP